MRSWRPQMAHEGSGGACIFVLYPLLTDRLGCFQLVFYKFS